MSKRWVVKERGEEEVVNRLMTDLNVDLPVATLLTQRGISDFDSAKKFFRPELSHLHDPFLLKDMDKAIERIQKALEQKEKILVFGDYDVDGTTAVALVYTYLQTLGAVCEYYIPDRYKEGYGISTMGIDYAKSNGFSLIIALDCGIKSVDKIAYANTLNVDFIICDHHRPGAALPNAVAVLDPKRDDCAYPFKELSGCGIGFKLVQALCSVYKRDFAELECLLDLVVVSIAADIVPIVDENRVLAFHGLRRINSKPREGLKIILELANHVKPLTISDLVFIIAPRINAAGRIESGKSAVELLVSDNCNSARTNGVSINKTNGHRKDIDTLITKQALEMIEQNVEFMQRKSTVLFNPEWHKGVVGIVASRLTEKYYRPTIVLTANDGIATGSARSVKNFDVYDAIEACSDLLEQFGGHKYAAGLSLKIENVDAFTKRFEEIVSSTIHVDMLTPEVEIDLELNLADISDKFIRILKQFGPFGPGNMAPIFVSNNVSAKQVALVKETHVKMQLSQKDLKSDFSSIAFNQGHHYPSVTSSKTFSVCYCIEENEFRGNTSIQLNVKDIKK